MERLWEYCRQAAVFVAAAGVVVLVAQRAFDRPQPSFESGGAGPRVEVRNGEQPRPVVYRIYERGPDSALAGGAAPSAQDHAQSPVESTEYEDSEEQSAGHAETDLETLAQREELVERGHELLDGFIDSGVADADRADELRLLTSRLPLEDRIELVARLSTAVNNDEIEVDPAHLPM